MTEFAPFIPAMPAAEHPAYHLANDRVVVKPVEGIAVVDGVAESFPELHINVLSVLAERADSFVGLDTLSRQIYYDEKLESVAKLRVYISQIRQRFGDADLADPKSGVIRTLPYGYGAVTSLAGDVQPQERKIGPVHVIADGRLAVDPMNAEVSKDDEPVNDITPTEIKVLTELAKRPNRIVGFHSLFADVWGYVDSSSLATLRVHISTLRKKLGDELGNPRTGALRTRRGIGYYAVSSLEGRPD